MVGPAGSQEVQAVGPFGPATVVHRDVVMAEQRQDERELGRADPRAVVTDEPPPTSHIGCVQLRAEVIRVAQALQSGAQFGIVVVIAHDLIVRAQSGGAIELRLAAAHRHHTATPQLGQLDEHEADRTQPDNRHRIARQRSRFLKPADYAGQRLDRG